MHKLEVQDSEIMKAAIQQEFMRSQESRYNHRLHGVRLVCAGLSCYEVADLLGHSPRTIAYWVYRFEKSGFSGLADGPKQGRPTSLDEKARKQLNNELRLSPQHFGYKQNLWDCRLISHHLEVVHGIRLGIRQCQRIFNGLGFRRRKPKSVLTQTAPAEHATYMKTASAGKEKRR